MLKVKEAFSFFGLSFFSNRISRKAKAHTVLPVAFSFLLTFILLYFGVILSDTIPFSYHYQNATQYREALYDVFQTYQVELWVENSKMEVRSNNEEIVIDTYSLAVKNEETFFVVLDSRKTMEMYDDFVPYYKLKNQENSLISREAYLALTEEQRKDYELYITYTGQELLLTKEKINSFENYFEGQEDNLYKEKYVRLDKTKETYENDLYDLYIRANYPEMTKYEKDGGAPKLRNYYFQEYIAQGKIKYYLFIFDDILVGNFLTNKNIEISFYGSFPKQMKSDGTPKSIDNCIITSFKNNFKLSSYIYFMNFISILPLIILVSIIVTMLVYSVDKLLHKEEGMKFGTAFKIVGIHLYIAALFSALLIFICGFFLPRGIIFNFVCFILLGILLLREAVLFIGSILEKRKKVLE